MSRRSVLFKSISQPVFTVLVLVSLMVVPLGAAGQTDGPALDVIVQGVSGDDLAALVEAHGGQVTRQLGIIDAVAAQVPAHRLAALERAPGV